MRLSSSRCSAPSANEPSARSARAGEGRGDEGGALSPHVQYFLWVYDVVGNILSFAHSVPGDSSKDWTRNYQYGANNGSGVGDDATIITRDDVKYAKPDPDLFLAAARRMGMRIRSGAPDRPALRAGTSWIGRGSRSTICSRRWR